MDLPVYELVCLFCLQRVCCADSDADAVGDADAYHSDADAVGYADAYYSDPHTVADAVTDPYSGAHAHSGACGSLGRGRGPG